MRQIAFAGTPIRLKDLIGWARAVTSRDTIESLNQAICSTFNVTHCFFVSSGRAALFLLLQALRELSCKSKTDVVIPSYTCYSVPAAIVRAGLKIRVCDINISTLDYDFNKLSGLDFSKVLCIVSSNLFGIPNDLIKLEEFAKNRGIYLVDDAAQCMGGRMYGKFSGTFGNAGIYSLGKGKNITSIEGGIIVTNSTEIADILKPKIIKLREITKRKNCIYMLTLLAYSVLLHPRLCWIPAKMPFLNLDRNQFDTQFSVESYSKVLGAMAIQLFNRLDEITSIRIRNAEYLRQHLEDILPITLVQQYQHSKAVYLRFPILINNKNLREMIVRTLKRKGLGVAQPYPSSIAFMPGIRNIFEHEITDIETGETVASQLITLPTQPYVTRDDLDSIISVIRNTIQAYS